MTSSFTLATKLASLPRTNQPPMFLVWSSPVDHENASPSACAVQNQLSPMLLSRCLCSDVEVVVQSLKSPATIESTISNVPSMYRVPADLVLRKLWQYIRRTNLNSFVIPKIAHYVSHSINCDQHQLQSARRAAKRDLLTASAFTRIPCCKELTASIYRGN